MNKFCSMFQLPKFPVDSESMISWCTTNVPGFISAASDSTLKLVTSSELTKNQQAAIVTFIATLTQNTEATKLSLPHNLIGSAKSNFENQVKTVISGKTWDTLTVAQRTFSMGGTLSASDYDSLPVS